MIVSSMLGFPIFLFCFFCSTLLQASTTTQNLQALQPALYADFLNENGQSDPEHYYEATSKIVRMGEPGMYHYSIMKSSEDSLFFVSPIYLPFFVNWMYHKELAERGPDLTDVTISKLLLVKNSNSTNSIVGVFDKELITSIDEELKSNQFTFMMKDTSIDLNPITDETPTTSYSDNIKLLFLGLLVLGIEGNQMYNIHVEKKAAKEQLSLLSEEQKRREELFFKLHSEYSYEEDQQHNISALESMREQANDNAKNAYKIQKKQTLISSDPENDPGLQESKSQREYWIYQKKSLGLRLEKIKFLNFNNSLESPDTEFEQGSNHSLTDHAQDMSKFIRNFHIKNLSSRGKDLLDTQARLKSEGASEKIKILWSQFTSREDAEILEEKAWGRMAKAFYQEQSKQTRNALLEAELEAEKKFKTSPPNDSYFDMLIKAAENAWHASKEEYEAHDSNQTAEGFDLQLIHDFLQRRMEEFQIKKQKQDLVPEIQKLVTRIQEIKNNRTLEMGDLVVDTLNNAQKMQATIETFNNTHLALSDYQEKIMKESNEEESSVFLYSALSGFKCYHSPDSEDPFDNVWRETVECFQGNYNLLQFWSRKHPETGIPSQSRQNRRATL
jgi:hypothetical protein